MCTTGQRSNHGSPHPLDRMTLNLTCRHCLLLSLDPRGQQQLGHEVTNFRHQTYAPTTKSTYMSQMHSYLSFCVFCGYQPLSAAALTLNCYAALLARTLSASFIPGYLNMACILHLEHGLTDPTKNNFQLATTSRGFKPAKGLTVFQKKPITPQILLAFKSHLMLDNPLHATFSTDTGKNNRFPFLDIFGYFKNTYKNPKFGKVRHVPTREFPTKFPDWDLSHSSKFGIFVGIL